MRRGDRLVNSDRCKQRVTSVLALLKSFTINKNLREGAKLHAEIAENGLLEKCPHICSALISMYAKCGAFTKARYVLQDIPIRNVVFWNALITGYVLQGHSAEALSCVEEMQNEGISPDAITFSCMLKACGSIGDIDKGEQIHNEIVNVGLLRKDIVLGNALVDMYIKCGAIGKAEQILNDLPLRNIVTWNTLIAGYVQLGQGEEALKTFQNMQNDRQSPDPVTFTCMLKACGITGDIEKGKQIHMEILDRGLLVNNVILGTALVDMYAKCGMIIKAAELLQGLSVRDVVSWNTLIAAYVEKGQGEKAINCFNRLQHDGLCPTAVTFIFALKACSTIGAIDKGKELHDEILIRGLLGKDIRLGTALVDMYTKFGALSKAHQVLDGLPIRDSVAWNTLITGYAKEGQIEKAFECFKQMQSEGVTADAVTISCLLIACGLTKDMDKTEDIYHEIIYKGLLQENICLGTTLVDTFAKCGAIAKAAKIFEELHLHDVVSWNAVIAGFTHNDQHKEALKFYKRMQIEGVSPDAITFSSIVMVCGSTRDICEARKIHVRVVIQRLIETDIVLYNALIDMYAKLGLITEAEQIFNRLSFRNTVSWNVFISAHVGQGRFDKALDYFMKMQMEELSPDAITFICVLKACSCIGTLDKGEQIHYEVINQELQNDSMVGTALVDMYGKCGALQNAELVFNELPVRTVSSWNALIDSYAHHGCGKEAIKCLKHMLNEGLSPNGITFLCIMNACSHSGLLEEGEMCFMSMYQTYATIPDSDHHSCMIDLYGRAGFFMKAFEILKQMPYDSPPGWDVLLGACRKLGNVNLGRFAFEQSMQLDHYNAAAYLLMMRLYSEAGMQEDANKIDAMRTRMLLGRSNDS